MTRLGRGRAGALVLVLALGLVLALAWPVQASSPSPAKDVGVAPGQQMEQKIEERMDETVGHGGQSAKLWDLLWRALNALVVVLLLVVLLRKPLSAAMANRTKTIQEELESLERKKNELGLELEEIETRLSAVQAEKESIIRDFVARGEAEKARIIAEAEAKAERIKLQTRKAMEQEAAGLRQKLYDEVAELAVAKATELIKKEIQPQDQIRLIDEYLAKAAGGRVQAA